MGGSTASIPVDDPSSSDNCAVKPATGIGQAAAAGSTLDEPFFPETIAFRWGQASPDERRPGDGRYAGRKYDRNEDGDAFHGCNHRRGIHNSGTRIHLWSAKHLRQGTAETGPFRR